jgi:NAD(P)-dependent dehydrogenase (short-subunit alcohol dehydrogenase family)
MPRDQQLAGQTLLVIGGSSGIGLEIARRAHEAGAEVILTARDPVRLQRAGLELGGSIAAFDATDFHRLGTFFAALRTPVDHVLVTGPGHHDVALAELDVDDARRELEAHLLLPLHVAREVAADKVRPGGTLLFIGCTDGRPPAAGSAFTTALTAALFALTKSLAFELAPIRVNVIALPVRRVVGPGDVAALAVHLMVNTAITGETFEVHGGLQLAGT